jgi:hypothetical protein
VKAKELLGNDPVWTGFRFNFGKDRCHPESTKRVQPHTPI